MAAGPNLATHLPIFQVQEKGNTTPFTYSQPEAAGQTFAWGTPVQMNVSGYVQAWDGTSIVNTAPGSGILGIAESNGQNLATAGVGAPVPPFGQITGPVAIQTYPPPVPGQPKGVNIALGTPTSDGRTLYMSPREGTIFYAQFDSSNTTVTSADFTPAQSDIGAKYGLTKDAGGTYWYVDKFKTGANACVQIVGIGEDGFVANGRVRFQFLTTTMQIM